MPSKVLITGANGHLGFRVVVSALSGGYYVRAVVRRQAAADQIKKTQSTQPYLKNLEIVLVEDLLKEGAFDDVVKGVDAVIHVASPLTKATDDYHGDVIQPAIQMTTGLLRSVAKSPSVKRVVVTSSIVCLDFDREGLLKENDLGPIPGPHDDIKIPFQAYVASKRLARSESMKFVESNKPGFDIINIMPAVVLGRNELTTSVESFASGTNRYPLNVARGIDNTVKPLTAVVHVNDVAALHVLALNPDVKGNQNFIASAENVDWNDVSGIVMKKFPEAVEKGLLPLGGKIDGLKANFDGSKAQVAFGIKWIGFEEQLKDLTGHYLEILESEGSA